MARNLRRSGGTSPRTARRRVLLALLVPLAAPFAGGSGDARSDEPARTEGPRTELVRLDGTAVEGRLEGLGTDGVRWAEGSAAATAIAPEALREVRFEPAPSRPAPRALHLRVTSTAGDRVVGTFAGPSEEAIRVQHATAGVLAVPFEAVRSIETLPAGGSPCLDSATTHPASPDRDRVYARSGDVFAGVVVEAAAEGIRIETERGAERTVAWDALTVVHLQVDPAAAEAAGLPATFAEVETDDGSRFVAREYPTGDATKVAFALRAVPKTRIEVPLAAVRRIRTRSDRFAYASELSWTGRYFPHYEDATPGAPADATGANALLERLSAPRADRRPSGCPLRVQGREHARGFGVLSKTRIEVPLDGRWKTFETGLGIDDEALLEGGSPDADAPPGDVDARILGDDRVLWEARGVKGGEPARKVGPLDVSGVKVLVLEVDWGGNMAILDRADWLDPVLTR